jgi:hypothetical protein
MLKSSSLCLHSSNLGTFWLKIEQFWSFDPQASFVDTFTIPWASFSPYIFQFIRENYYIIDLSRKTKMLWNGQENPI